jgi:hypothetical protein
VALQLRAIHVFVGASSGQRFLVEFMEVGGALTVLEILSLKQSSEDDLAGAFVSSTTWVGYCGSSKSSQT